MQTSNRIFDDLARVANGAVSTLAGIREELEGMIRHQLERLLADRDTVPREEFEAVKAMAAKARSEQEKLAKRVSALEAQLGGGKPAAATKSRRAKPAAKSGAKATAKSGAKSTAKSAKAKSPDKPDADGR